MKRKVAMGVFLAVAAAAPAIVAPQLVTPAQAQERAEYPDVPKNHWAYEALDKLSRAGILEGRPGGVYEGNKSMTRYEFAVAIARLLDKQVVTPGGEVFDPTVINNRLTALEARPVPDITRAEVNDLITALRTEFATELERLGVRVDALEGRVSNIENRVAVPPRVTFTPSLLHRAGGASYINNQIGAGGRVLANGDNGFNTGLGGINSSGNGSSPRLRDGRYSYTDFELRLTDRISDRLTLNAAGRAVLGTQEDNWLDNNVSLREANVVADLSDRSPFGVKGLSVILGRQRTKFAQGLLYDNDLAPTDQLQAQFNLGPFQVAGFWGGVNNLGSGSRGGNNNPYTQGGAAANIGAVGGLGTFTNDPIVANSGAIVGFPTGVATRPDDQEGAARVGFNLFKISGNPVQVGITRLFSGATEQQGDSIDLTIPLFNRTVGVEYVRERRYANGATTPGNPKAYNITLPVLRTRLIDLNAAYGKADDDFEFFLASSANPFARTYAEALFDRPMALGSPLIAGGGGGNPRYAAAKKVYDFSGTFRLLRRLPLDFRYYHARGSGDINLGDVFTVGSTFNLTPGLDLEVKYGQYNPKVANANTLKYVRIGANVGF